MRRMFLKMSAAALAAAALPALAQGYPDRAVKILNPFPAGATDAFARLVARKLQAGWEQPVIVEGRAGAGGMIAVTAAAKAPPDGYTLLVTSSSTQIVQPVVRKTIAYDAEKDFIPIAATGLLPQLIVVHPSLPVRNLRELIEYARANPGQLTYGSSGLGTTLHLAGEVFSNAADVKLQHVPYKTAAESITGLLGGQVQVQFDTPANSGMHVRAGKLRAIALMGDTRTPALPEVPTTAELGWPAMKFYAWLAVYAPAGTPTEVVNRITQILRPAMVDADMKAFYELNGFLPTPSFGAEFAASSRAQRLELAEVLKKAKFALLD
jgi:tripartite-type tricarboxylate transporter receptor subunit TctC